MPSPPCAVRCSHHAVALCWLAASPSSTSVEDVARRSPASARRSPPACQMPAVIFVGYGQHLRWPGGETARTVCHQWTRRASSNADRPRHRPVPGAVETCNARALLPPPRPACAACVSASTAAASPTGRRRPPGHTVPQQELGLGRPGSSSPSRQSQSVANVSHQPHRQSHSEGGPAEPVSMALS